MSSVGSGGEGQWGLSPVEDGQRPILGSLCTQLARVVFPQQTLLLGCTPSPPVVGKVKSQPGSRAHFLSRLDLRGVLPSDRNSADFSSGRGSKMSGMRALLLRSLQPSGERSCVIIHPSKKAWGGGLGTGSSPCGGPVTPSLADGERGWSPPPSRRQPVRGDRVCEVPGTWSVDPLDALSWLDCIAGDEGFIMQPVSMQTALIFE